MNRRHTSYAQIVVAPSPENAPTLDDLAERLTDLRLRAGNPSFAEIARRIGDIRAVRGVRTAAPGRITVYDAFRTGRSRMDIELVVDIVAVLGRPDDVPKWRRAHAAVLRRRAQERNGHISTARAQVARLSLEHELDTVAHEAAYQQLIDVLVSRGDGDQAPLALISGLPGIGKTALARSVARQVATELGTDTVIEAGFRSHSGGAEGTPDPGDVAAEIQRVRRGIDADAASIVLLDDITSLDDLSIVASILPKGTIVIATSRRDFATPDGIAAVVLEPLDDSRAQRLLEQLVDINDDHRDEMLPRLVDLTGKLPLSIALLAGQLKAQEGWSLEDHVERLENSTSATLAPSLETAYAQLSSGARHALHLLALYPGRPTIAEADAYLPEAASATNPPWNISEALEELSRENFLSRTAGGRYELHDVVRALAKEHSLTAEPLSRRRVASRDLSRALKSILSTTAISPESITQFDVAVEAHLAAVALASDHHIVSEVKDHTEALSPWLQTTARWNDIILINEHTRRLVPAADRPEIERQLCHALTAVGRLDEAEVILTNLAAAAEPDPRWFHTTVMLADVASLRGDTDLCLKLAQQALEGARAADDAHIIVAASAQLAQGLIDLGRGDEAVTILEDALREKPSHDMPFTRIAAIIEIGAALTAADQLTASRARFEQARAEAIAVGHRGMTIFCEGWIGGVDVMLGNVSEGRRALELADAGLRDSGREKPRSWIKFLYAESCLLDGDIDAAKRIAEDGLRMSEEHNFEDQMARFRAFFASIAIEEGHVDEARSILEPLLDSKFPRARVLAREHLGVIALHNGDAEGAAALWNDALAQRPAALYERGLRERLAAL